MPDIFDTITIEKPQDVFDTIEPEGDIFDDVVTEFDTVQIPSLQPVTETPEELEFTFSDNAIQPFDPAEAPIQGKDFKAGAIERAAIQIARTIGLTKLLPLREAGIAGGAAVPSPDELAQMTILKKLPEIIGDTALIVGKFAAAHGLFRTIGFLQKLPKSAGVLTKALETAKLFAGVEAIEQVTKAGFNKITDEDVPYEGAIGVLKSAAFGMIFSLAAQGTGKAGKLLWSKLKPTEQQWALKQLGLKKGATLEEINKATRKLALKFHPDKVKGFREDFEQVMKARDILRRGQVKDIVKARIRPKLLPGEVEQPVRPPTERPVAPKLGVKPKIGIKVPPKPIQAKPEAKKPPEAVPVAKSKTVFEIAKELREGGFTVDEAPPLAQQIKDIAAQAEPPGGKRGRLTIDRLIKSALEETDAAIAKRKLEKFPRLVERKPVAEGKVEQVVADKLGLKVETEPTDPANKFAVALGQESVFTGKDNKIDVWIDETANQVVLNAIKMEKEKTGLATQFVNQLKDYVDDTGKKLIMPDPTPTAKKFLDKFEWLEVGVFKDPTGATMTSLEYTPTPSAEVEAPKRPVSKIKRKIALIDEIKAIQQSKDKAQVTGKPQTIIKEGKEVDIVPDEDVSIVDDPGTLGAAETIPKIDASLEPKGKPVSARDVIFQMERDFGVPFRSKVTHIFKKKIAHFQVKSKVIRSIDVRNLSTATHELGHHLDRNFFGNIRKHPPPGANQELLDLGKALYGKRKPPGGYKSEGVAEYMRLWLTDNDAENRAPFFTKWFEKYLKDNPDVAKRLRRTRKLIEKWKAQGAVARIESQIVTGKIRGEVKEQLEDAIRILETLTLDRFAPLRRLRDEIGAEQFAPSEDPFIVATANATKAGAKAAFFALEGTTDLAGIINGISLQEALAPVSRDIKNWQTWAVAARARHLHKLGINPGISKTDADFVFEQFKSPEFEKALDEFTKWNHRGLDYMVEAGALEKSVAERIKKRHPVYVPFKRAFKEGEIQLKFVPAKGFVETGSPIKKIKGSGRAIKDPIQEAMLGMEAMISTAQKAQVSLAMAKLADRFPGVGKFIVRIPAPKIPITFQAEQIKGDVVKYAIRRLGADPVEANFAAWMETWDEDLTVFTKGFKFTGKENVISIVRNDKRLFYEVSPDLFKTLKGLDKFTLPWYLDFWMGRANRALKLGATGVNPTFALRNFIRDLQTFGFTTEFARGNFLAGVKGIGKDVATDFSGIAEKFGVKIPKSQDVLRFRALGGELATFILQDKTGVKHLKSTVLASDGTKYVVNTFLHPIHVLRELVGITEVGTRIGEFGPALREGERRYGKDTADAAMFALNAAQDVTVNFSRMGTLFQILNQIIPFSNVAVQGPAKIFRTIRKRPLRSIRRAMIGLLIPAVWLWWRNKDKKWWKSLPTHEKGNYLHFENPKDPNEIFRFPIAFELGHIFQTIPVMALDAVYQNDPSDVDDMLKFVLDQANPIDWPAAVGPIIDVKENLDFAGRPVVPRSVEGRLPEDRFTTRSTALMKFIGRKLKVSPAQLDYLANTYSGGVYGRVARLLSLTNEAPETKSDLPIIGTLFLRDPFAPRKEIEVFYNRLELLSQKNQSKKITKEERREFIIRGKIARAISPQWRLLRDSKTVKQRKVIYGKIENAIIKGDKAISR